MGIQRLDSKILVSGAIGLIIAFSIVAAHAYDGRAAKQRR